MAQPTSKRRLTFIALITVLVLGGAVVGLAWSERGLDRGVRGLPSELRGEVYARALAEILAVCARPAAASGALREHCLEQARFVARFPECSADCQAAVSRVLPPPPRR